MIPWMNQQLEVPVTYGELLHWLELWFLMSTMQFDNWKDFWPTESPDMFAGAPWRLLDYMSSNWFENLLSALKLTDKDPPAYKDQFWEVRKLIDEWNANMMATFSSSLVSCLDKSMSKWVNQFTCPGFMVVPRKPWPFGNEYHTIACSETEIIYYIDLVEGKDEPREHLY